MSMLALTFVSCEDIDFEEGKPQTNPQEPLMSFDGLSVGLGDNLGAALDLSTLSTESLNAVKTVQTPALTEGQTVEYVAYVGSDENFSNAQPLSVVNGNVDKAKVNSLFREFYGRSPKARDLYFRFAAFIAEGKSWTRVGTKDTYFAATKVSVTPIPESFTIESAYYLIGGMQGWSWDTLIKFDHSDADVYDDPEFTVTFKCDANCYWKIVPQSAVESGLTWDNTNIIGVVTDGDTAMEGKLINSGANAAQIVEAGTYVLTINMMDNTYKLVKKLEPSQLYVIGTPNGWNINGGDVPLNKTTGAVYAGTVSLNAGQNMFRFYAALGDWESNSYGSQVNDSPINCTDKLVDGNYSGDIVAGKGSFEFNLDAAADYNFTVDLDAMTFKMELVPEDPSKWTYLYVVGNLNGWNTAVTATEGEMVCKNGSNIYTGTFDFPDSGDGKSYFRFFTELNGTWDKSVQVGSGNDGNVDLEFEDGMAMAVAEAQTEGCFVVPAGKYTVTADLNEMIITVSKAE